MKSLNCISSQVRSIALLLLLVLALAARSALALDLIGEWNQALLDSIRSEDTPPCLAARNLAIVHGAIYDAGVLAEGGAEEAFLVRVRGQKSCSVEAAMNAAALGAALFAHPSQAGRFEHLFQRLRLASSSGDTQAAEALGRHVAQMWVDWRTSDGTSKSLPYIPKTAPGAWKRTPPFYRPPDLPAWCLVRPFMLIGSAQFRPPGPPPLDSPRYADDYNQVKYLGGSRSTERTSEQTEIARFWSDFSYSVTPPGHWNQIAQAATSERPLALSQKGRIFAILNIALADAGIACWEAKYHYNSWRPVTAIRAGDQDGNAATEKDLEWSSLLVTPSFPEYISGHSAFSGAGAAVLGALLGTDQVDFSVPSDTLAGQTRAFHSFRECAAEISQSRLYGGIHFPSALRDGLALGEKIGTYVLSQFGQRGESTLFSAPVEMESGYWIGGAAPPGQNVEIDRFVSGKWDSWTNLLANGPVVRWKASELPEKVGYRIVIR